MKTCLQKGIISSCGCANPLYRAPDGVIPCSPDQCEYVLQIILSINVSMCCVSLYICYTLLSITPVVASANELKYVHRYVDLTPY